MTINGERVWVPDCRRELIAGLQRMGIFKVAGVGLDRLPKADLHAAYCRERSRIVRRQQQERSQFATPVSPTAHTAAQPMPDDVQLTLFGQG